jgi:hypothetical protein
MRKSITRTLSKTANPLSTMEERRERGEIDDESSSDDEQPAPRPPSSPSRPGRIGVLRRSHEGSSSRGARLTGKGSAPGADVVEGFGRGAGPMGSAGTIRDAEGTTEEAVSGASKGNAVKAIRHPEAASTAMFNITLTPKENHRNAGDPTTDICIGSSRSRWAKYPSGTLPESRKGN